MAPNTDEKIITKVKSSLERTDFVAFQVFQTLNVILTTILLQNSIKRYSLTTPTSSFRNYLSRISKKTQNSTIYLNFITNDLQTYSDLLLTTPL